jgi:hypothetical protein
MIPNPKALWLNDPQAGLNRFRGKGANRSIQALQDGTDGLVTRPQDDHAG